MELTVVDAILVRKQFIDYRVVITLMMRSASAVSVMGTAPVLVSISV
jgi:hypothetical protein